MEIATVPTQEKYISMSETIESTPRTFTEQEIFGDDAPTTTPDAVSGPLISVARENKQGTKRTRMEVQQKLFDGLSPCWAAASSRMRT